MGSHLKADVRQKLENMRASLLCPDCASNIGEVLVFASCARQTGISEQAGSPSDIVRNTGRQYENE